MCGIAGIYKFNNESVSKEDIKKMTDSISHRGPDAEGQWVNRFKNVGLGHRRLSVIDLSQGANQPMHYLGRYSITFNGEIYNYLELKADLIKKGYFFSTESDTEVLLALYAVFGRNMLLKLDGMFSFVIWDKLEEKMFCARDRFGEKPFFYYKDEKYFIFGSEMKALWAFGIKKKLNQNRLKDYILKNNIIEPENSNTTFYENIFQLDSSHYALLNKNGKIEINKYWSLDNIKINNEISFEDAKAKYYKLFKESVERRMRSDVPLGSSLSGGIDSSSIVCLIDNIKGNKQIQKVFSARFNNFLKDEGIYIQEVLKQCKNIESFDTWPSEFNIIDLMEKTIFHQEEPFGSSSILAQWKVMELAKENEVTVLLDGQGADEFLAGYLSEYKVYLYQLYLNNNKKYYSEYESYMKKFGNTLPIQDFKYSETLRMKLGRFKKNIFNQSFKNKSLKQSLKFLINESRLKELLRYSDRNSMAHSREVRLPFLSHKLVEFVFSLPDDYILRNGWTKFIHRKALEINLPSKVCWRIDKVGYETPQQNWLNSHEVNIRVKSQQIKYEIDDSTLKNNFKYGNMKWRLFMSSFID